MLIPNRAAVRNGARIRISADITEPPGVVLPVTRVTYKDGTQELFSKELEMRVAAGVLVFADQRGVLLRRLMTTVRRIEDADVLYGGHCEAGPPAGAS